MIIGQSHYSWLPSELEDDELAQFAVAAGAVSSEFGRRFGLRLRSACPPKISYITGRLEAVTICANAHAMKISDDVNDMGKYMQTTPRVERMIMCSCRLG